MLKGRIRYHAQHLNMVQASVLNEILILDGEIFFPIKTESYR